MQGRMCDRWATQTTAIDIASQNSEVTVSQGRKQVIKRSTHARPGIHMQHCSAVLMKLFVYTNRDFICYSALFSQHIVFAWLNGTEQWRRSAEDMVVVKHLA